MSYHPLNSRSLAYLAATLCAIVVVASALWIWNTFWLLSSVGAMADQLERDGVIDAARAAEARGNAASTGAFLMQGHDRWTLLGGVALSFVSVFGFGLIAAICLRGGRRTGADTETHSAAMTS